MKYLPTASVPMSAFDPYHKWLGIPPKDRPPSHYRLLGLEAFETDEDVIDAAANQRMAYLQGMASGEFGEHSQKLLNELAQARLCLMDRKKKAAYDKQLRATSESEPAGPPPETAKAAKAQVVAPSAPAPSVSSAPSAPSVVTPVSALLPPATTAPGSMLPPSPHEGVALPAVAQLPTGIPLEPAAPPTAFPGTFAPVPPPLPMGMPVRTAVAVAPLPAPAARETAPRTLAPRSIGPPPVSPVPRTTSRNGTALVTRSETSLAAATKSGQRRKKTSLTMAIVAFSALVGVSVAVNAFRERETETPSSPPPNAPNSRPAPAKPPSPPITPSPSLPPNDDFQVQPPVTELPPTPAPPPAQRHLHQATEALARGDFEALREHLKHADSFEEEKDRRWAQRVRRAFDLIDNTAEMRIALNEMPSDGLVSLLAASDSELHEIALKTDPKYAELPHPALQQRARDNLRKTMTAVLADRRREADNKPDPKPENPSPSADTARPAPKPVEPEPAEPRPKPVEPSDPKKVLAERGLKRDTSYWILNDDDDLRSLVSELSRREREVADLAKSVKKNNDEIADLRARVEQFERFGDPTGQRFSLNNRIEELRGRNRESNERLERVNGDLRRQAEQANQKANAMVARYRKLEEDPAVQEAIKELPSPTGKLGPRPLFEVNLGRIRNFAGASGARPASPDPIRRALDKVLDVPGKN